MPESRKSVDFIEMPSVTRAVKSCPPWEKNFPIRSGPRQQSGNAITATFHTDGCIHVGFMKNLRLVMERHVRKGSRAVETDHARSESPHGKSCVVKIFTRVGIIKCVRHNQQVKCVTLLFRMKPHRLQSPFQENPILPHNRKDKNLKTQAIILFSS